MIRLNGYRRLSLACLLLLWLAGCMGPAQTPKEPVISYAPVTHDVRYPQRMVLASDAEEAALKEFLARNGTNPGGNISLMSADPDIPKNAERMGALMQAMHEWGYPKVVIVADPMVPSDRIRVGSSKISADVPDCPDWSYAHMANYRNTVMSNFGCAQATNLVRMVEDPNDLVAGTGDSRADAARSSGIIDVYRTPPDAPSANIGSQTGGL